MNEIVKWTEISDQPDNKRFELLSSELKAAGFENEFCPSLIPAQFAHEDFLLQEEHCDEFREWLKGLKKSFSAFRIGGFFQENLQLLSHEYSAELLKIQVADSLDCVDSKWWPRNNLLHAFKYFLANEVKQIDLSNPVLVIGANAQSKSIIAALIKLGFTRFTITDREIEKSKLLVEELEKSFFSTRFEKTEASFLTQLPSIYFLALSTLRMEPDEDLIDSIVYFNFLTSGALWIEACPQVTQILSDEAKSLGFQVRTAVELMAQVDVAWAEVAFHQKIDLARLSAAYKTQFSTKWAEQK